jgi:hypothetical protein
MTTREHVNRVGRRAFLSALVGFVMFAGGMTAGQTHREFRIVAVCGFALFGGSIIYLMFSGRCVHCQRPLARLFYRTWGSAFNISSDFHVCPYCGKSLDDDVTI